MSQPLPLSDEVLFADADELRGRIILITGAGGGIGKHAALVLAQHGAKLVIGDVNAETAKFTSDQISASGGTAISSHCDVTSWTDQVALFELAIQTYGQAPQVVIANAGIGESFHLGSTQEEDGKPVKPNLATIDINLTGAIYTAQLALYYWKKNKTSDVALIFIGSMLSLSSLPLGILYSASKHGILGLTQGLHQRFGDQIRFGVIAPWFVETNILGTDMKKYFPGMTLVPIDRVAGAIIAAATDSDPETNGSIYTLPDDGPVVRISKDGLTEGGYKYMNEWMARPRH
ncbi:NAD(P)-binding protein [Sistotremastrum niveocremeum HHB9708]|uniref:NAD(P)-binding protein n=1 Tax=Sistotremastrum niveocremeum HHB9708 TaxID=1314777 RepID=A0A164S3T3_9AGAM|nr:NAD(P)-binding protein [Sistotremastrum niveocremeum HHB9708]